MWFHGYSPTATSRARRRWKRLRALMDEEKNAQTDRKWWWKNHGRQGGVIEYPMGGGPRNDEAKKRMKQGWRNATEGVDKAGSTAILYDGGHLNSDSQMNARDSEYIAGRKLALQLVCAVYGIAPAVLGLEPSNFASADAYLVSLYQNSLAPYFTYWQEALEEMFLFAEYETQTSGVYIEFNLDEELKGSADLQSQVAQRAVGRPWRTVNEQRKLANLPPIEGGDELTVPANIALGDAMAGAPPVNQFTDVTEPAPESADVPPVPKTEDEPDLIMKAVIDSHRKQAADAHAAVYARFYKRMRQSLKSQKALTNKGRWQRELYADLRPLATETSTVAGLSAARKVKGKFDPAYVVRLLDVKTRRHADSIVDNIETSLDAKDATVDSVFDTLEAGVAAFAAVTVASLFTMATEETARQSGKGRKRWVVTSDTPRPSHAEMNGETVPFDEAFSNGGMWPRDSSLPVEESAGCDCELEIVA